MVLPTGASGGLGRALAVRLSAEHAKVTVTGRRADVLEELASTLGATALPCDLAERDEVRQLADTAATVDILICNAALPAAGLLGDLSTRDIDRALDVNLRAPMLLARSAAAGMVSRGEGHIVLVSSMAAKVVSRGLSVYASTKAGLRGFGLALREELHGSGVGVSLIYPGPISHAGMWADAGAPTPPGVRPRPPEAVANAVVQAIQRNRPEIDVASLTLRLGAALALLRPGWFALLGRRART